MKLAGTQCFGIQNAGQILVPSYILDFVMPLYEDLIDCALNGTAFNVTMFAQLMQCL
jgi:hypothetical protein